MFVVVFLYIIPLLVVYTHVFIATLCISQESKKTRHLILQLKEIKPWRRLDIVFANTKMWNKWLLNFSVGLLIKVIRNVRPPCGKVKMFLEFMTSV